MTSVLISAVKASAHLQILVPIPLWINMMASRFLLSPSNFRNICEHHIFRHAAAPSGLLRLRQKEREKKRENPVLVVHGFLWITNPLPLLSVFLSFPSFPCASVAGRGIIPWGINPLLPPLRFMTSIKRWEMHEETTLLQNSAPLLTYTVCYYFCRLLLSYTMESIFPASLRIFYYTYMSAWGTGVVLFLKFNVHSQKFLTPDTSALSENSVYYNSLN